jgi:hypothetical protein
MWIARSNFTDADGEEFPAKITHVGSRATGFDQNYPVEFRTVSRFEHPEVFVDGLPSNNKVPDVDEVDPDMKFDRKIVNVINSQTGITLTRNIYAFSQRDHDNYHVQEYILTNTGNTDGDEEIEVGDQVAEGVYLHLGYRYGYCGTCYIPGNEWGANVMNDVVGNGINQHETDLRARYTWMGNSPGAEVDPMGSPILHDNWWFAQEGDDARLIQPQIMGTATIHAPAEPGGPDADNVNSTDPSENQPSVTGWIGTDHGLLSDNSPFDKEKMQREYDMVSGGWAEAEHGHMNPTHAEFVDQDGDYTTVEDQGDVKRWDGGGFQDFFSYGPYTLQPGESVRIVQAQAVDGLNHKEAIVSGRGFKQAVEESGDGFTKQQFTIPSRPDAGPLNKNEWVMTGVDSLFDTFQRSEAAWQSDEAPPRAPNPPARFEVTSGVDNVTLEWEPQQGGPERTGWEVYRSRSDWQGHVSNDYEYELIAELGPGATSYQDTDVQRGLEYFYHIKAVGDAADNDGSVMTREGALRSNRMYTQTYAGASLKRQPGTLTEASIVPNPYVISADETVTWPERDRLAFLDIPDKSKVRIYTELGELVKTIEHTDGSGDEFWRLQTEDRQVITSGVYIAVIENNETGEIAQKKFSVIR